jgi:hypothetical protein
MIWCVQNANQEIATHAGVASEAFQILRSVQTVQKVILSSGISLRASLAEYGKQTQSSHKRTRSHSVVGNRSQKTVQTTIVSTISSLWLYIVVLDQTVDTTLQ